MILFSHILPNALGPVIVRRRLRSRPRSSMWPRSLLGLGPQDPSTPGGNMLNDAQDYLRAPLLAIFPRS
jgi:ABC-type dipeptide/oligopeptide/nickel transport system permease subunit